MRVPFARDQHGLGVALGQPLQHRDVARQRIKRVAQEDKQAANHQRHQRQDLRCRALHELPVLLQFLRGGTAPDQVADHAAAGAGKRLADELQCRRAGQPGIVRVERQHLGGARWHHDLCKQARVGRGVSGRSGHGSAAQVEQVELSRQAQGEQRQQLRRILAQQKQIGAGALGLEPAVAALRQLLQPLDRRRIVAPA